VYDVQYYMPYNSEELGSSGDLSLTTFRDSERVGVIYSTFIMSTLVFVFTDSLMYLFSLVHYT
jgi:hypothetical protein